MSVFSRQPRWVRLVLGALFVVVLVVAFLAYLRPDFLIDLGGQMFLCS